MAVTSSGPDLNNEVAAQQEKKGRSNCHVVRVIGSRIYDSRDGKTCHQVISLILFSIPISWFSVWYGEKAEEVALFDEWKCPKCRGICNCSLCMKKRGHKPTGILVHTAKENGFSSVSELLHVKGPENFGLDRIAKDASVSLKKPASTKKSKKIRREGLLEVNHSIRNDDDDNANSKKSGQKKPRLTREVSKNKVKVNEEDKSVLIGKSKSKTQYKAIPKKEVKRNGKDEGVIVEEKKSKTQSQDVSKKEITVNKKAVGNFVEKKKLKTQMPKDVAVCRTAKEERDAANFKNGAVLSGVKIDNLETKNMTAIELCKINKCTVEQQSKQIDNSIPLPVSTCLTNVAGIELPHKDAGDALQFFEFCAAFGEVLDLKKGQAEAVIREIIFGRRARRSQGSLLVHFHIKLLLLIQEDIGEEFATLSPANGKNSWLKAFGKCVSECNFISMGFPSDCFDDNEGYDMLSTSQKFKLLNFLCDEALNTKQRSDAVRTDPILLDVNGRAFWRLKGYSDQPDILLQDVGSCTSVEPEEKWFVYDVEQKQGIEKYISSLSEVSFGVIGMGVGISLLSYGFGAYFNVLPGSEWSALMLTYGFPLAIIGMALKYAELKPVPCLTYSDAQMLRETSATPILKQVRSDVIRYRYGDEQHLDEALKRIFQYGQGGGIPRRSAPILQMIREEVTEDGKYCLVLVFEAKALQLSDFDKRQVNNCMNLESSSVD
ncbi:hypothetical protein GH714_013219 [Hevea brasiliensis]|uniref:DDT domain-containing protein n=1 Tax=Hevea brasiliensis TaxID=3981 RepID=A0A6A6ML98_HEVBR|nr:hypothetical protein GH714_013219 [Hevea brasiliensis]